MVLSATKEKAGAANFASDSLRRDPDFWLKAVAKNGLVLPFAPRHLREQKDYVR